MTAALDRERLVALVTALDASPRSLQRTVCRGWVGDWQITGKHGHVMAYGDDFLIYAATPERGCMGYGRQAKVLRVTPPLDKHQARWRSVD